MGTSAALTVGKEFLSRKEAAGLLGVSLNTLDAFSVKRMKVGRKIIYRRCDLERFVEANLALKPARVRMSEDVRILREEKRWATRRANAAKMEAENGR